MNQARQYSQKPGAIRERTRMTDIETKWRKDRARLLVRVKAGAVPNEDSQEKYKLSLAEINVVRADAGLPELDRPYRVNAFAGMMAINAETERSTRGSFGTNEPHTKPQGRCARIGPTNETDGC